MYQFQVFKEVEEANQVEKAFTVKGAPSPKSFSKTLKKECGASMTTTQNLAANTLNSAVLLADVDVLPDIHDSFSFSHFAEALNRPLSSITVLSPITPYLFEFPRDSNHSNPLIRRVNKRVDIVQPFPNE